MRMSYIVGFALVSALVVAGNSVALIEAVHIAAGYAESGVDNTLNYAVDAAQRAPDAPDPYAAAATADFAAGNAIAAANAVLGQPLLQTTVLTDALISNAIQTKMGTEACAVAGANALYAQPDAAQAIANNVAICEASLAVTVAMQTQAASVAFMNVIVAA